MTDALTRAGDTAEGLGAERLSELRKIAAGGSGRFSFPADLAPLLKAIDDADAEITLTEGLLADERRLRFEAESRATASEAKLVESWMDEPIFKKNPSARMALAVAARDVRRGRKLTASEKFDNLTAAIEEDDPALADRLRALAAPEKESHHDD